MSPLARVLRLMPRGGASTLFVTTAISVTSGCVQVLRSGMEHKQYLASWINGGVSVPCALAATIHHCSSRVEAAIKELQVLQVFAFCIGHGASARRGHRLSKHKLSRLVFEDALSYVLMWPTTATDVGAYK